MMADNGFRILNLTRVVTGSHHLVMRAFAFLQRVSLQVVEHCRSQCNHSQFFDLIFLIAESYRFRTFIKLLVSYYVIGLLHFK